jgi:hypothetical protein
MKTLEKDWSVLIWNIPSKVVMRLDSILDSSQKEVDWV